MVCRFNFSDSLEKQIMMVMESMRSLESKLMLCIVVGVLLAKLLSRLMFIAKKTKQPTVAFFISLKSGLFN